MQKINYCYAFVTENETFKDIISVGFRTEIERDLFISDIPKDYGMLASFKEAWDNTNYTGSAMVKNGGLYRFKWMVLNYFIDVNVVEISTLVLQEGSNEPYQDDSFAQSLKD